MVLARQHLNQVATARHAEVKPASGSLETRHGLVAIRWESSETGVLIETTLPDGVEGVLSLPDGSELSVSAGTSARRTSPW